MSTITNHSRQWWKEGVFYQIYPASFKDSTGAGTGDLAGILSKLDYLKDLGVDCIWISPFYDSPQVDLGYDISNYEDVYPPYGTVADVEKIIKGCHDRGMKIVFDLVINHTSDQHEWFKASRSSKDNPKRDWYIWRPARIDENGERQPPNNWRGNFNGSVWTWDEETQEYYMHLFCPEQPDLNWENEETRKAIYQTAMTFWLEKGVDGFRVDTVNMYSKGSLDDVAIVDPNDRWQPASHVYCNGPRMHEYLREMDQILSKYGAITIGELPATPDPAHVRRYISAADPQLSMVFQFDIVDIDIVRNQKFEIQPWPLTKFKDIVSMWQTFIEGTDSWTTVFFENHDQPRCISRYANDDPKYRVQAGKMMAIVACALTGTLFVYQGQELGMTNVPESWPESDYIDVEAINYLKVVKGRHGDDKDALSKALKGVRAVGRDNARTPMQWDDSANAGFSTGAPWHRVNDNYTEINAKAQQGDQDSLLNFWRSMIKLRKEHKDMFVYGHFDTLDYENSSIFSFVKTDGKEKCLCVANFTKESQSFDIKALTDGKQGKILAGNVAQQEENKLQPFEARLYLLE